MRVKGDEYVSSFEVIVNSDNGGVGVAAVALIVYDPFSTVESISELSAYALIDPSEIAIAPVPTVLGVRVKVYALQFGEEEPKIAPAKEGFVTVGVSVYCRLHGLDVALCMPVTVRFGDMLTAAFAALKVVPPPLIATVTLNGVPTVTVDEDGVTAISAGEAAEQSFELHK